MIEPHKNRTINPAKPVKVYWNLHRDCFSVQQDGLVVCHADQVELHVYHPAVNDLRDDLYRESDLGKRLELAKHETELVELEALQLNQSSSSASFSSSAQPLLQTSLNSDVSAISPANLTRNIAVLKKRIKVLRKRRPAPLR